MKIISLRHISKYFFVLPLTVATSILLSSCTKSGSVSVSGAGGGGNTDTGLLGVTAFQGVANGSWTLGPAGQLRTNNTTLTFVGTCARGVDTVKVNVNATDSGVTAPCTNQTFTWIMATPFAANTTGILQFIGYTTFGSPLDGATLTENVTIDTTPPTAPTTVTVNGTTVSVGGTTVISNSSGQVTIDGGISSNDAVNVTSSDLTGSFPTKNSSSFSFTTTLNNSESRTITFHVFDDVGNASNIAVTVIYRATLASGPLYIQFPGMAFGTAVMDSGSYTLERATMDSTGSNQKTSGSYVLDVGTTNILKQLE